MAKPHRITQDEGLILGDAASQAVLVPSSAISFFYTDLPAKGQDAAQTMALFALEDDLIGDIEMLHAAVIPVGGKWCVAVCAQAAMDAWLDTLTAANVRYKKIIPDVFAVPEDTHLWVEGDIALVRLPERAPFAVHKSVKAAAFASLAVPTTATTHDDARAEDAPPLPVPLDEHHAVDTLELMEVAGSLKGALNLCQGAYAQSVDAKKIARAWYKVAAAAALAVVAFSAALMTNNAALKTEVAALTAANARLVQSVFPDVRVIGNPRAQAEQQFLRLEQLQQMSASGLNGLMAKVLPVVSEHPQLRAQDVNYRNRTLQLAFDADNVAVADALIEDLRRVATLTIDVETLAQEEETARLTLSIRHQGT